MKRIVQLSSVILFVMAGAAAANAETANERQACENDAFHICGAAIPDRHNVFMCLMANRQQLSPACRSVMAQYARPNSRRRGIETTGQGD